MAKPIIGCTVATHMGEDTADKIYRFLAEKRLKCLKKVPTSGNVRRRLPGEQGAINDISDKATREVPA